MSAAHATGARCEPLAERVGYGRRAPGLIPTGVVVPVLAPCFAWFVLELARPAGGAGPDLLEVDAFPVDGGCVALVAPGDELALLVRLAGAGITARAVAL